MEKTLKTVKGLSKAIYILAIIAKVFVTIALVVIALGTIAAPIVLGITEVENHEIVFKGVDDHIKFVPNKENPALKSVKFGDRIILADIEQEVEIKIIETLENTDKTKLIVCIELGFVFALASIIVARMILRRIEKLFKNINKEDTPFTDVNVELLKKIGALMIWSLVLTNLVLIPFDLIDDSNVQLSIRGYSVIEILFVYVAAYIFEYGYKIQNGNKEEIKESETKAE